MIAGWSYRLLRRYQSFESSRTVGVVKVNEYGRASFRPLTAVALAAIVTSYRVACGSGVFGFGVNTRIVGPAHRNVPLRAGAIEKNGATTSSGMRPRVTIGSENRTRISVACST